MAEEKTPETTIENGWSCPKCGVINNPSNNTCRICSYERPPETAIDFWTCDSCGRHHFANVEECGCGEKRKNIQGRKRVNSDCPGAWAMLGQVSRDPAFVHVLEEMYNMKEKKSHDYAPGDDPYANFRMCAKIGLEPWLYVYIRRQDKIARQETYIKQRSLSNESFEDALIDDMVYCALELILWREAQKAKEEV